MALFKLGANAGDNCEIPSPNKSKKVASQYEKEISLKDKACVIVEQKHLSADGDACYKTTDWLVKGIGLVQHEMYRLNKDKWYRAGKHFAVEWKYCNDLTIQTAMESTTKRNLSGVAGKMAGEMLTIK